MVFTRLRQANGVNRRAPTSTMNIDTWRARQDTWASRSIIDLDQCVPNERSIRYVLLSERDECCVGDFVASGAGVSAASGARR
jgi:hypothetical protein